MDNHSPINRAVVTAGSIAALARELNVTYQAVQSWLTQGWVPAERALQIESRFGIPRSELVSPKLRKLFEAADQVRA